MKYEISVALGGVLHWGVNYVTPFPVHRLTLEGAKSRQTADRVHILAFSPACLESFRPSEVCASMSERMSSWGSSDLSPARVFDPCRGYVG